MHKYKQKIWFKLDNAAKLYPAVLNSRTSTLFRISAELDKPVNVSVLQGSVDKVLERLEYYKVSLQKGFFWYYFEHNKARCKLQPDSLYPCGYMPFKNLSHYPFRIRIFANRIALEISHALSDGTAALDFLKIIIYTYLVDCGHNVPYPDVLPDIHNEIQKWEYEDSFKKIYSRNIPGPGPSPPAYHLHNKLINKRKYIITRAELPADLLIAAAKQKNISVTTYLLAVYFSAFLEYIKSKKIKINGPVRMMVPVNLRRIFPSRTMLNFFLTVGPEIDPRLGEFSFEEICNQVYHFMSRETNGKLLLQQVSRNVGIEQAWYIKTIPLFLKNIILPPIYKFKGQNLSTSTFSNLGVVKLPEIYGKFVKRLDFIPAPSKIQKIGAGIITYNNKVYINFGRLIKSSEIERLFFSSLVREGIPVKIDTNEVV